MKRLYAALLNTLRGFAYAWKNEAAVREEMAVLLLAMMVGGMATIDHVFPLYNAPPGTAQRMAVYFYLSADGARGAREAVLRYTDGVTFEDGTSSRTLFVPASSEAAIRAIGSPCRVVGLRSISTARNTRVPKNRRSGLTFQ